MPRQLTLFGKPIRRLPSRRATQLLSVLAALACVILLLGLPSSKSTTSLLTLKNTLGKPLSSSSSILNPFRPAAHAPPIQENSTSGDSSWYTNWNWLSPFSSSTTLDENRSLLPPLPERPPVYTYYDHTVKKDALTREAENNLLLTWRRAWWAQGFKPVILGAGEAMNSPKYQIIQGMQLENEMNEELMRWLAWESMGSGVLCHYLTLPMGASDEPLLAYFRRGEYPFLRRFEGLGNGLFSGSKSAISAVVDLAVAAADLKKAKSLIELLPEDTFRIDPMPDDIAYYDAETIRKKYPNAAVDLLETGPPGMMKLKDLINAHLVTTWQNSFDGGISILKPLDKHMSTILEPAKALANSLSQCPSSPVLSSCPPNKPECKPCVSKRPMKIVVISQFRNTSNNFQIGVIPHPHTHTLLTAFREEIDIPYIRRKSARDPWLSILTRELLGTAISGSRRIVKFKEAVASTYSGPRSLYFTAESPLPTDLDWHFGFTIPLNTTSPGEPETPGNVPQPFLNNYVEAGTPPSPEDLDMEQRILRIAIEASTGTVEKTPEKAKIRSAVEAWNLADSEAWKFAKAFLARKEQERETWEVSEKRFAGGAGTVRSVKRGGLIEY